MKEKLCTLIENGKIVARVNYTGRSQCAICCKRCDPTILINSEFVICSSCAQTVDKAIDTLTVKLIKEELDD